MKKGQIYVKSEIEECRDYISALESGFNEVSDAGLTDCFIFQLKAAEARLKYLMEREGVRQNVARNI